MSLNKRQRAALPPYQVRCIYLAEQGIRFFRVRHRRTKRYIDAPFQTWAQAKQHAAALNRESK